MDKIDYLNKHIPHRLNLLITYRERFSNLSDSQIENIRDLYRCAKDISIMMVRLLLDEMGIKLPRNAKELNDLKEHEGDVIKMGIIMAINKEDILNHNDKHEIFKVLVAANRAVAHTNEGFINHNVDKMALLKAIDFIEHNIEKNIYHHNSESLMEIMGLPDNNMQRSSLNLNKVL
ncbi:hypothetical protein [Olivibacter domesticus]|uniref:Uncharacterized protein n=1 Tax=Olivibacter domesticus TaxID=407022 RepID=A0A1H7KLT2_OLID1|nr:hypothetical protein [Olivibacter domesticus]SEK86965.1 hypothetical protein SAMN05661044_01376 [Olivibacter domesticus]